MNSKKNMIVSARYFWWHPRLLETLAKLALHTRRRIDASIDGF